MWTALGNLAELSRDSVFPNKPIITEDNLPNLKGKVYVVTGATAGIGYETARLLLKAGARVWIIGRSEAKLEAALLALKEYDVRGIILKFEDPSTIAADVAPLLAEPKLDGVVHNAGMNYRGSYFAFGFLDLIVVNVISPWILQSFLDPLLERAAESEPALSVRIVWIASSAHYFSPQCGGINWDNINEESINGRLGFGIYGQTKAMNIYQAKLWGQLHPNSKVMSVSTHPGTVDSEIRRYRPDRNRNMAMLCVPTVFGGYAEIAPLLQPLTVADNGAYFRPYGARGRVRPDVAEALEGPRLAKFGEWIKVESARLASPDSKDAGAAGKPVSPAEIKAGTSAPADPNASV